MVSSQLARSLYFSRDYTTHDHRFLSALANSEHQVFFLQLEQRGHALEDRPIPASIERIYWAGGEGPATLRRGPVLLLDLRRVLREIEPDPLAPPFSPHLRRKGRDVQHEHGLRLGIFLQLEDAQMRKGRVRANPVPSTFFFSYSTNPWKWT